MHQFFLLVVLWLLFNRIICEKPVTSFSDVVLVSQVAFALFLDLDGTFQNKFVWLLQKGNLLAFPFQQLENETALLLQKSEESGNKLWFLSTVSF